MTIPSLLFIIVFLLFACVVILRIKIYLVNSNKTVEETLSSASLWLETAEKQYKQDPTPDNLENLNIIRNLVSTLNSKSTGILDEEIKK